MPIRNHGFRCIFAAALFGGTIAISSFLSPASGHHARAGGENSIQLVMFRSDDTVLPGAFGLDIEVALENESGVTDVTVTLGDGVTVIPLETDDDVIWAIDLRMNSLAELISKTDGEWIVDVDGSSASVTTFDLNTASFQESDFFDTPVIVSPAVTTNVPPDVIFGWTDTTGGGNADLLVVEICSVALPEPDCMLVEAPSVDLDLTDTEWAPPTNLTAGPNEFVVIYVIFDDVNMGPPSVNSGSITWDDTRFIRGAQTLIELDVAASCSADSNGDTVVNVADLLTLLAAWGPNPGHPADINDDGAVNVSDLLALLAAWGPC